MVNIKQLYTLVWNDEKLHLSLPRFRAADNRAGVSIIALVGSNQSAAKTSHALAISDELKNTSRHHQMKENREIIDTQKLYKLGIQ